MQMRERDGQWRCLLNDDSRTRDHERDNSSIMAKQRPSKLRSKNVDNHKKIVARIIEGAKS